MHSKAKFNTGSAIGRWIFILFNKRIGARVEKIANTGRIHMLANRSSTAL
jgi:hypothetical protein